MDSFTHAQNIIQSLTLEAIDENIIPLKKVYLKISEEHANSNASITLIKMIRSLLSYLESKKADSYYKAIPSLSSLSDQLKKITLETTLTQNEIIQIVTSEIRKFKILKQEITSAPILDKIQIDELNTVILSMDWEITDSTIKKLEGVVEALFIKSGNNKIYKSYLTIILNTGKYIGTQKARAHSDSMSFLKTIFERFKQISLSKEMSLLNKKENLDEDIKRFHQFKQKISEKKETHYIDQDSDNESVTPALSHVNGIEPSDTDGLTQVTQLPDEEDYDSDSIQPALAGKANLQPGSRDVMDDLFNLKDSPADELLDAIHLMDVHGSNPDQAAQMLDRMEEDGNDGVTKFTPERIDNEPIPEIGDRLDEFFSLENTPASPQNSEVEPTKFQSAHTQSEHDEPDHNTFNDLQTIEVEEDESGIVPFNYEDDEPTEEQPSAIDNHEEAPDIDLTILNRLKANINSSHWLTDESAFLSIKNDLSLLEKRSGAEQGNSQLLEVMKSILDAAHIQSKSNQNDSDQVISDQVISDQVISDQAISDQVNSELPDHAVQKENQPEKSKGFFGKIKSLFGS